MCINSKIFYDFILFSGMKSHNFIYGYALFSFENTSSSLLLLLFLLFPFLLLLLLLKVSEVEYVMLFIDMQKLMISNT